MYADKLVTLYLNKSKLRMRDDRGNILPYETELQEVARLNPSHGSFYEPDYIIKGFYRPIEGRNGEFIISEGGPNTLYVTGVPRDVKSLTPYRIPNKVVYSSYWEQSNMGYLFQVILN